MAETKSVFDVLNAVDVSEYVREKNNLSYLAWASCWQEVMKRYPDSTFKVYSQKIDERGNERPWFDDGKSGWVKVGVTINGVEMVEHLAIMDFKNQPIPAEKITSTDANKSVKRCLVKCCALHGIGLYIYRSEDLPEEITKAAELKERIKTIATKKAALSDKAKERVKALCVEAEKLANPELAEDLISGNYNNIDNVEILENLEKNLLAVRKQ